MGMTPEQLQTDLSPAQFAEIERVIESKEFKSVEDVITAFTHEGRNNNADRIFDRFFNRADPTTILKEHTAFLWMWTTAMSTNTKGIDFSSFLRKVDLAVEDAYLSANPREAYLAISRKVQKYASDKGVFLPKRGADASPTDVVDNAGGGDEEPF